MLGDYTFEAHWHWLSIKDYTPNAKRVMVSNGNTVVIGSLTIQEDTLQMNQVFNQELSEVFFRNNWNGE
jgi:outer membrane lipoprotein-sorting protein